MRRKHFKTTILILAFMTGVSNQGLTRETRPISFSERIPAPSEMSVKQIVTGRISTLQEMDIVNVGKRIPETYSDGKLSNTPGYDWHVSKHFALKTNFPDDQVRLYLELLEMAYPHYVEIFGMEPPDIQNRRIAVIYSPTHFDAAIAMMDDGFQRGPGGGGETMFYNRAGYNFKSSREQHQRYIVMHETTHAFQMALMDYTGWLPEWFVEGTADGLAHHIYDPDEKRLQVMNFDRGSPMDYIRLGLEEYEKLNHPTIEDLTLRSEFYRGINFLIIHFMLDDPLRSHFFKIYRDEMTKRRLPRNEARKKSVEVLKDVFGDWPAVEKAFAAFVSTIDKTFHVAAGPWEQEGGAYFVRIDNSGNGLPRLDILLRPGEKPAFKPYKIDQPRLPRCRLVGPVARGVSEPSLGLKIDCKKEHLHRGKAGMGFGLFVTEVSRNKMEEDNKKKRDETKSYNPDEDELYEIVVEAGKNLVFNGTDFGTGRMAFPLPETFIRALENQENPELGMTLKLRPSEIEAVLRTGEEGEIQYVVGIPVSADVRAKLMERDMALIAQGASHCLTPYFDDGRDLAPYPVDYAVPASSDVFRNPADKEATRLAKAIWLMADLTPQVARNLFADLVKAAAGSPSLQAETYNRLRRERPRIAADIAALSGAHIEKAGSALQTFAGTTVRFEWAKAADDRKRPVRIVLNNPSELPLTGELSLSVIKDGVAIERLETRSFRIGADGSFILPYAAPPYDDAHKILYRVAAEIRWAEQAFSMAEDVSDPYPWSTMEIVKPARLEDGEIRITALLRGPLDGETKGKMFMEILPTYLVETASLAEDVTINPYEVKTFERSFKIKDGARPGDFAVDVRFELSIDEEPVKMEMRSVGGL